MAVEYHVSDDISRAIVTDGSWVFMILLNFVSNAFKCAAPAPPRCASRAMAEPRRRVAGTRASGAWPSPLDSTRAGCD